nr:low specificity L-threonine aldolase-like isoform X2 [Penaeus vannamei]
MNRCTRMATSSYCMLRRNVSHTLTNRAILMQQLRRWYHPPPAIAADFQGLLVDLRSDTITKPTLGMKQAMMDALLGDDVYREDPTVKELERRMAIYTGKEAALFVPSGTMGNLIAVLGHCENRGCEVLLGDQAHIFLYEQAGMAQVGSIAKSIGIPLHMDGARLMNAVIASGESAPRILQACETASICLSKGLGTPVGSVIVGSEEFMYKALRLRKVLGGGMRQAGMLAAAGLYAMDNMINRLADDHRHAQQLAQAIYGMGSRSVKCSPAEVHTNIAIVHLTTDIITPEQFCKRLLVVSEEEISEIGEVAIKVLPWTSDSVRFVTHFDVSSEGIEAAVAKLKYVISEVDSQLD